MDLLGSAPPAIGLHVIGDVARRCSSVYWAGVLPRVPAEVCSTELFNLGAASRAVPSRHGRFETVRLDEVDLSDYKSWPVLLDEAIRLLARGQRTTLHIRYSESALLTTFSLAYFFRSRSDLRAEVVHKRRNAEGQFELTLSCRRLGPKPTLDTLEFCVITDGNRDDMISLLAASIEDLRTIYGTRLSVALSGPESSMSPLAQLQVPTRWVPQPEDHFQLGWITEKKNRLVATSRAENLVVLHDRYAVDPNFVEQLTQFGADFDVLIPGQLDLDGHRFPDYVALPSHEHWGPVGMLEYRDYSPAMYVNGGALIGKRRTLRAVGWNPLLFWNDGEDVEFTKALVSKGVVPRIAPDVRLRVTTCRPGYLQAFGSIPFRDDSYGAIGGGFSRFTQTVDPPGTRFVSFEARGLEGLLLDGIYVRPNEWTASALGLQLHAQLRGEITVDLGSASSHSSDISVSMIGSGRVDCCRVDGSSLSTDVIHVSPGGAWRLDASPGKGIPGRRFMRFEIEGAAVTVSGLNVVTREGLELHGFEFPLLVSDLSQQEAQKVFESGWGGVEDWGGIWAVGFQSTLCFLLADGSPPPRALMLRACSFVPEGSPPPVVGISVGRVPVGTIGPSAEFGWHRVELPHQLVGRSRTIRVNLVPSHAISPLTVGHSDDARELSVAIDQLNFEFAGA